ncbi:MAG: hypothetical protein Q4P05_08440 [Actinomycetaceae bacterium]|nr:hypothetical protein [Actinomycetaceae bacterium]
MNGLLLDSILIGLGAWALETWFQAMFKDTPRAKALRRNTIRYRIPVPPYVTPYVRREAFLSITCFGLAATLFGFGLFHFSTEFVGSIRAVQNFINQFDPKDVTTVKVMFSVIPLAGLVITLVGAVWPFPLPAFMDPMKRARKRAERELKAEQGPVVTSF